MVMLESVHAPLFAESIDVNGVFHANGHQEHSARMLLDALSKWDKSLAPMRAA